MEDILKEQNKLYGSKEIADFVDSLNLGSLVRAYHIFRLWFDRNEEDKDENCDCPKLTDMFHRWMLSPDNGREKDIALRMASNKYLQLADNIPINAMLEPEIRKEELIAKLPEEIRRTLNITDANEKKKQGYTH